MKKKFWRTKTSWVLIIMALIGDFAVPYILAPFYHGYDHNKMIMSVLTSPNSPVRGFYKLWLIVLGIIFIVSAVNIYFEYRIVSEALSRTILMLMVTYGIGSGIIAGIFSQDAIQNVETTASKIHGIGTGLGFMALMFASIFLSRIAFKCSDKVTGFITGLSFIGSLIFFMIFMISEKQQFQNTIMGLSGIWERLLLLAMYFPLGYISIKNIIIKEKLK